MYKNYSPSIISKMKAADQLKFTAFKPFPVRG